MKIVTFNSPNYPVVLDMGPEFPKCLCGGTFKVQDCFNKRKVHKGTIADCELCGEHFIGYSKEDIKRAVTQGQSKRAEVHRIPLLADLVKAGTTDAVGPDWLLTDEQFTKICDRHETKEAIAMLYMMQQEKNGIYFTRIDGKGWIVKLADYFTTPAASAVGRYGEAVEALAKAASGLKTAFEPDKLQPSKSKYHK